MTKDEEQNEIKSQSIVTFVATEIFKAIIGFVTLWFFRPVWDRIVEWWNRQDKNS